MAIALWSTSIRKQKGYLKSLDTEITHASVNYTPPGETTLETGYRSMSHGRDVTVTDLRQQTLNMMPGFRFTWYYSEIEAEVVPNSDNEKRTKAFVRNKFYFVINLFWM